jgi:predicted Zn-dependent protease with MMP-like domain
MTQQEKQIEDQLRTNYRNALKLIPPELRDEFREVIMPLKEFQSLAPLLSLSKEIKSEVIPLFLQGFIRNRFSINRFGRRVTIAKANLNAIYTELVRNLWS